MARPFAKVSEEEIVAINEAAFFYPSDLVSTKTTIPLRVGRPPEFSPYMGREERRVQGLD